MNSKFINWWLDKFLMWFMIVLSFVAVIVSIGGVVLFIWEALQ